MQRNWMAVVFLGVVVVLFGAYSIVNRSGIEKQVQQGAKKTSSLDGSSASSLSDNLDGVGGFANLLTSGADDKDNLTKTIARVTFEQMKALDQQGKSPFDEANTNTSDVRGAVERSVNESANALFDGVFVSDRELKISTSNTKDAKRRYLISIEEALARHPAKATYKDAAGGLQGVIERACTTGDAEMTNMIAGDYMAIAQDVVTIPVPSQWLSFHKGMITYYRQGNVIFDALAKCYDDPLKGFTAAQSVAQFGSDAVALQKSLQKLYTEVGL